MSDMSFWDEEDRRVRKARYLCRFYSWKLGRQVTIQSFWPGDHWVHKPLIFTDTREPI